MIDFSKYFINIICAELPEKTNIYSIHKNGNTINTNEQQYVTVERTSNY